MGENMLAGEPLRQEVAELYRGLLGKIATSYPLDQKLTGFSALVGSQYENNDTRLLIYGRAVDGWRNCWQSNGPVEESLEKILKIPGADRNANCEMNWIARNRANWSTDKKKSYNYKFSSFWCGARDVLKALESKSAITELDWPSHLAWSNVYKISPERGNPQDELRSVQIPHCIEILQAEIQHLEPKRILFITGGWGIKILESIGIKPEKSTDKIIQFAGNVEFDYGSAKVVVAIRPERQKRDTWVKEVVSAF